MSRASGELRDCVFLGDIGNRVAYNRGPASYRVQSLV